MLMSMDLVTLDKNNDLKQRKVWDIQRETIFQFTGKASPGLKNDVHLMNIDNTMAKEDRIGIIIGHKLLLWEG